MQTMKKHQFFFQTGKQHYTDYTIQELELNNRRIIIQKGRCFAGTKEIL